MTSPNKLWKTKTLDLTSPVRPGRPAVAGSPYIPAHTEWVLVTETRTIDKPSLPMVYVPPNPNVAGDTGHYTYGGTGTVAPPSIVGAAGSITVSTVRRVSVSYPAQPAVAPQPAVPPSPAQWQANWHLGWNSGARSSATYAGSVKLTFTTPVAPIGFVVGLSDPAADIGQSREEIQFAWQVTGREARVLESGTLKTSATPVTGATVFEIVRRGTDVFYLLDGVLAYASDVPSISVHLVVDTSAYAGDDAVEDTQVVAYASAVIPANGSVAGASAPPTGTGTDGTALIGRVAGRAAPSRGTLVGGAASTPCSVAGVAKPTTGVVSDGTMVCRAAGAAAPTAGRSSAIAEFVPAFGAAYGAAAPTTGYGISHIGRVATVAGSAKPTIGSAGIGGKVKGSSAPTFGLAIGGRIAKPDVVSYDADFTDTVTVLDAVFNVVSYDADVAVGYIQPVSVQSEDAEWVVTAVVTKTVVVDVVSYDTEVLYFYNDVFSVDADFTDTITLVVASASAQAWWANLMPEDGPEVTRFTGGMGSFRQLARIGNTVYGMVYGGDLYPIGGVTDNGTAINPVAKTVNSQYGSMWSKQCRFAMFGSPNDVKVTPIVDGTSYTARTTTRGRTGERLAMLPGGLIGVNWAFKIEAVAGSQLRLNNFTPRLDELSVGQGK